MDYRELIARVTSHIPDKEQGMVRYYTPMPNGEKPSRPGWDGGSDVEDLGVLEETSPRPAPNIFHERIPLGRGKDNFFVSRQPGNASPTRNSRS